MSLRPPRSLQGRLVMLVMVTVVGVWLVAAAATWLDMQHELEELLDSHLAQAAALLVAQQGGELDDDMGHTDAPPLHRYASKVAFQVWHEGVLVMHSANAPSAPMGPTQVAHAGFRTQTMDGVTWRIFGTQGAEDDVQVYVGELVESRADILWALVRSMLWPLLVALPLLALAAWWGVRQGLAPLRTLGQLLRERDPRALTPITLADSPREMAPMLGALNDLLARIRTLMESERRFTADAAHELRTPIAAIRAQAQVAQGEAVEARRRHALQATVEGCDRATRLVEQLLTLSRLDAQSAPPMARVDLHALAAQAVADAAPAAIAKQQSIELVGDGPCPVQGNDALVAVLIRNLVDNAVRYSPVGARVRVSVAPGGPGAPQAELRVDDSGPGLSAPDQQRLGERFFRVLGSGEAGSGLGWSIVQRVAQVHGATVQAGPSADLGGWGVVVGWPPAA